MFYVFLCMHCISQLKRLMEWVRWGGDGNRENNELYDGDTNLVNGSHYNLCDSCQETGELPFQELSVVSSIRLNRTFQSLQKIPSFSFLVHSLYTLPPAKHYFDCYRHRLALPSLKLHTNGNPNMHAFVSGSFSLDTVLEFIYVMTGSSFLVISE